jgi:hypothetical protein
MMSLSLILGVIVRGEARLGLQRVKATAMECKFSQYATERTRRSVQRDCQAI